MADFNEKLAQLCVEYATPIQPGDKVVIQGSVIAQELILAVYGAVVQKGGLPMIVVELPGQRELWYAHANETQLQYVNPIMKLVAESYDKVINIWADYDTKKLQQVDPQKMKTEMMVDEKRKIQEQYQKRVAEGKLQWTILPYPCFALAQEAGMGIYAYREFVAKALKVDKDDPIAEWRAVETNQDKLVEYLNTVDQIQVLGEDTDLTLSVKGRKWVNCCGKRNLPDGEVFTGPIEDSINGHIRFTFPGIYQGKEIENIHLEFKDGQVVNATAAKGQELLDTLLQIDGTRGIGEFAIGTNYGITQFTKSMLFDEKMGGTLHMALGLGFAETGSKSKSMVHWDILKDMKSAKSKVLADGKVIYQKGAWKI